jgi:hypothetical protein
MASQVWLVNAIPSRALAWRSILMQFSICSYVLTETTIEII